MLSINAQLNSICVTSYNSGGFGVDRQNFIKTLTIFSDILCVQEHFLLDSGDKKHSNTNKLRTAFGDTHDMFIVPAFKENDVITRGRGKGGLVTMWKKCYTKYVTKIKCDNFRIQATKLNFPNAELLIINLYFMVDPQNNNFNDFELLSLLAEIDMIVTSSNSSNLLLSGDINCDFARQSAFVNIVRQYFDEKGLYVFWNLPDDSDGHKIGDVTYTYTNTINNVTYSSTIDHFISNGRLYNSVIEADVINNPNNLSGHSPIYLKLILEGLNLEVEEQQSNPKPCWSKASDQEKVTYQESLDVYLDNLNQPEQCNMCETLCCDLHTDSVEEFAMGICQAVDTAAKECLPTSGGGGRRSGRVIPGWNEYVKPFQDESLFWDGVWKAAGCPNIGELCNLAKTAKMQYKYAVRRLKRASNSIQQDKFVESVINGGVNIFDEVKRFRGQAKTISSSIDGQVGSENISNHFAEIYRELYNKHEPGPEFQEVMDTIEGKIDYQLNSDLDRVTETTVRDALSKLKAGKSDAYFEFNSDCVINCTDKLINQVTLLFKWFLRTGKIPSFLLLCTLVPIVKDNLSDITSSDNYRAIAIGSLLLKWFDWLILILESDKLSTDELQFGFKAKSSTSMCTWAVSAVVDYYNKADRNVYACAMDLSKAFDLVAWEKLFPELLERGISPLILRCLVYIYTQQTCNVRWGSSVSDGFNVKNGVRQGAVSSPVLFCVYMNHLIQLLRDTQIGCQIQGIYLGIWVYADDIILLAPSRAGLQEMVKICENYANFVKLKFSTNVNAEKSKTKCLIFSKSNLDTNNVIPIYLNNLPLPYVDSLKHLGNILECDNSMSKDCNVKRAKFISKIHSLNQEFYFAHPSTVLKLYDIYACSFYGSSLWNVNSREVNKLFTSWNIAVRILFDVPRETHRYLIESISDTLHVKTLICSRFVSFYDSLNCSNRHSLRLLTNLCKSDHRMVLCQNLTSIARDCKSNIGDLSKTLVKRSLTFCEIPDIEKWRVPILKELLEVKNNVLSIDDFVDDEINDLINILCVD